MKKPIDPMSWDEIRREFEAMNAMVCVPKNMEKYPKGYIADEEKSVRWNREFVERENEKYRLEVSRLNTVKNKARDALKEHIYERIQFEVGHDLSREKARLIYGMAYERGRSYGSYEVEKSIHELIELATMLLATDY